MRGIISPSIMCANLRNLERDIRLLEKAKAEYLHFDIMDGSFVPNFTMGPDLMRSVREITNIPFDIHMMIQHPENHIAAFGPRDGDIIAVHQESTIHLQRTLQKIKEYGAMPAVALNPATAIYNIENVLDDIGVVLVMTVNPGFAGQKLIPATLKKISDLKNFLLQKGYENILIEVDGNVSFENAAKMRKEGADIFVAGTSSIYIKGMEIPEAADKLRQCIA